MNRLYPIFMNMGGVNCLVVGGGAVAERKVKTLMSSEASVTVLSPDVTRGIEKFAREGRIRWIKRRYRRGDLLRYALVIAATDSIKENTRISSEAHALGKWVNVVDNPSLCNFFIPSTFTRGDLKIAISTNGKAPGLARAIRLAMGRIFGPELNRIIGMIGPLRSHLKKVYPDNKTKRDKIMKDVLRSVDVINPDTKYVEKAIKNTEKRLNKTE